MSQGVVPLRLKLFHGLGSIAYGVKDNGFSTFLLIFYNQVVGLDAGLVSVALLVALVLDAFADPLIGYASDRTYTRWGRRLPWLYAAPVPLAFAWLLLWSPPEGLGNWIFAYLVGVAILVRTLVSCCEVPSVSIIPELTRDYDERTAVMRFRFLFGWGGGLVMLLLAYAVFLRPDPGHAIGQLNPHGYWSYGLFGGILMAVAVLASALGQHRRLAHLPSQRIAPSTAREAVGHIFEAFSHRAFVIVLLGSAMAYIGQGITFSMTNYLALFVWRFGQDAFIAYSIILFGSVIIAFLAVAPFARALGKRRATMAAGLASVALWSTPFLCRLAGVWPAPETDHALPMLFGFVVGANSFAVMMMICISSMIADVVEASEVETGRRTEGLFYAGNMFTQKCATGVGIFISGQIVSLSGFPAKAVPGQVDPMVLDRMTLFYIGTVVLLALASAWFIGRFPISRDDHEERVRQLASAAAD